MEEIACEDTELVVGVLEWFIGLVPDWRVTLAVDIFPCVETHSSEIENYFLYPYLGILGARRQFNRA